MRISRPRGFTLIELLIVIALVGILAGTVILSLGSSTSGSRQVDAHVSQLISRIELARRFALQRNREWGIEIDPNELRFLEWDPYEAGWAVQRNGSFKPIAALDSLPFNLKTEEGVARPKARAEQPDVILFSSGETTPFTLWLGQDGDVLARAIESDGLSPVTRRDPSQ